LKATMICPTPETVIVAVHELPSATELFIVAVQTVLSPGASCPALHATDDAVALWLPLVHVICPTLKETVPVPMFLRLMRS